jgi:NADPH2:quinone reductase
MSTFVAATAFGGPEVLSVFEETLGEPGSAHVRIRVHAIGTNPVDYFSYSGRMDRDETKLPLRVGSEAAGTVMAVGPDAVRPCRSGFRGR